jgi:hypothetical protein
MDHPDLSQTDYLSSFHTSHGRFNYEYSVGSASITAVLLASGLVALLSLLAWRHRSSRRESISSTAESRMAELGAFITPSSLIAAGPSGQRSPSTPLRPTRSSHQLDGFSFSPVVFSAWQPGANTLTAQDGQRFIDELSRGGQTYIRSPIHVRTYSPFASSAG